MVEADIKIAKDIWGKEIGFLEGHTAQRTVTVFADDVVQTPESIRSKCANVDFHSDELSISG